MSQNTEKGGRSGKDSGNSNPQPEPLKWMEVHQGEKELPRETEPLAYRVPGRQLFICKVLTNDRTKSFVGNFVPGEGAQFPSAVEPCDQNNLEILLKPTKVKLEWKRVDRATTAAQFSEWSVVKFEHDFENRRNGFIGRHVTEGIGTVIYDAGIGSYKYQSNLSGDLKTSFQILCRK